MLFASFESYVCWLWVSKELFSTLLFFIANNFQETHIVPESFVCLHYWLLALSRSSGKFSDAISVYTTAISM
jgi:hypothetical protein